MTRKIDIKADFRIDRRFLWIGITVVLILLSDCKSSNKISLYKAAGDQFRIGVAVTSEQLKNHEVVALITEQFNALTAEYEFMPRKLQPEPGIFKFETTDRIVDFAQKHELPLTGHMLCWNQMTPQWMFEDKDHNPLPREIALQNLKLHITTVMEHFKGKLSSWNVVNEAISDNPDEYLRDTPALRAIGEDYIQKTFEIANETDPDVPLYYNDYNVEDPQKLPKVIRLIRSLKAAGVRLDAVGIQGHWLLSYPDAKVIDAGIELLGKEVDKVIVTELDVDVLPGDGSNPYKAGIPLKVLNQQAKRYAELFAVFKKHHNIIPYITFWGIDDSQSWLNNNPTKNRTNYPMLFNRKLQPKPAYQAVIDELSKHEY